MTYFVQIFVRHCIILEILYSVNTALPPDTEKNENVEEMQKTELAYENFYKNQCKIWYKNMGSKLKRGPPSAVNGKNCLQWASVRRAPPIDRINFCTIVWSAMSGSDPGTKISIADGVFPVALSSIDFHFISEKELEADVLKCKLSQVEFLSVVKIEDFYLARGDGKTVFVLKREPQTLDKFHVVKQIALSENSKLTTLERKSLNEIFPEDDQSSKSTIDLFRNMYNEN